MSAADYLRLVTGNPSLAAKGGKRRSAGGEEQLHRDCFEWVQAHEAIWPILARMFHPANGGARSKGEAGKLKAMGVRPGVPDFLLPFPRAPWQGLAIELKSGEGEVSATQKDWLSDFREAGYVVGVARTLDEFVDLVERFLGLR